MRVPRTLRYDVVDVFTDRPFAGNQLAVVHGAEELGRDQCLALAREFGYSETTFPARPAVGSQEGEGPEYAVRIFTPAREIPFAGHPTLGTAWVLRAHGLLGDPEGGVQEVVQVCGAGRIGVRFEAPAPGRDPDTGRVELSAQPRELVGPLGADLVRDLLRAMGLSRSDLAGEAWVAGCGLAFVHLPVREEAVVRARPPVRGFEGLRERVAAEHGEALDLLADVNLYAVDGDAPRLAVHSRVFVPGAGVPEDPATGSAAAGLGMALVASGLLPDGGRYDIVQGVEMGRPSRLSARVEAQAGAAVRCHVAGQVQHVATGEVRVPDGPPAGPRAR